LLLISTFSILAPQVKAEAQITDPSSLSPGVSESSGSNTVFYDHWSVLTVIETITDLGGGKWRYSYEFTNTETKPIWHFGVWTNFDAGYATQTTFDQMAPFGTWRADGHHITEVRAEYDARNLNPNIIWVSHTWDNPWPSSPNPIPVGAHVSGFSFTANVLDTSPKYYYYETWGSYLPDGRVTAVGLTSVAPPAPEEWSFAIITDLHIGRGYPDYASYAYFDKLGRLVISNTGYDDSGAIGQDYYLTRRLEEVVKWINQNYRRYNIKFLAVLGDIANDGEYSELEKAKAILDKLEIPYFPVIGNHDVWVKVGLTPVIDERDYGDKIFKEVFNDTFLKLQFKKLGVDGEIFEHPLFYNYAFSYGEVDFICLDFVSRWRSWPPVAALYDETRNWLEQHLYKEKRRAILLSHHPMVDYAGDFIYGFFCDDLVDIEDIINTAKNNYETQVLANFAGHIHGAYGYDTPFPEEQKKMFMDANVNYAELGYHTAGNIPVITTESLQVASNEPTPKGIIRIVKMREGKIIKTFVDGEFRALNPYLGQVDVELRPTGIKWPPTKWMKWVIEVEAYAFTKRFTNECPGTYILEVDGERYIIQSKDGETVEFVSDFRGDKLYNFNLTAEGSTPEGESIKENINQTIKLKRPNLLVGGFSKVDITVIDPDGLTISKELNEIPGATYSEDTDYNGDGEFDDIIIIPERKIGDYLITVMPEFEMASADTYTLLVWPETTVEPFVLAENVQISNIPTKPYIVRSRESEVIPIIPATVDFEPDTLNLKSKGTWVTVYIELPVGHGYNVNMINLTSIILNGQVQAEIKPIAISDYDGDGIQDLMVKFNRAAVQAILQVSNQVEITISGKLIDNRLFEGIDIIRVMLQP
jgi:hypothetical protein